MYITSLLIILFNSNFFLLGIPLNSENVISKSLTKIIDLKISPCSHTYQALIYILIALQCHTFLLISISVSINFVYSV